MAAEAEHGEGDEGFGAVEAEGDTGDETDLGVGGLDEGVGQVGVQSGVDGGPVFDDPSLEGHEGGDAAAAGPADPAAEGVFAGLALEDEVHAEAFF